MDYFKNSILVFVLLMCSAAADVLTYEDSYIRFDSPEGWVKQIEAKHGFGYYFKWDSPSEKIFYQIHRDRKWAQWHMKGLHGKQNAFITKWKRDSELYVTGEPMDVKYDPENFVLTILWQREKDFTVSKMKLTSFGCLAFHQQVKTKKQLQDAEARLENIVNSLKIPESLQFYPEDLASELMNNMGGAMAFIVISILYLMFSLFQRSQMKHRRMEMLYTARMTCSR